MCLSKEPRAIRRAAGEDFRGEAELRLVGFHKGRSDGFRLFRSAEGDGGAAESAASHPRADDAGQL